MAYSMACSQKFLMPVVADFTWCITKCDQNGCHVLGTFSGTRTRIGRKDVRHHLSQRFRDNLALVYLLLLKLILPQVVWRLNTLGFVSNVLNTHVVVETVPDTLSTHYDEFIIKISIPGTDLWLPFSTFSIISAKLDCIDSQLQKSSTFPIIS